MPLRVSKALILCSGLLCTRSVSALSLSDNVPDWIILARKLASDEDELDEEEVWNVRMSASCSSVALVVCVDSWVGFIRGMVLPDAVFGVGNGGRALCHCGVGWNTKWDFELRDTFVGNWTFGFESSACDRVGAVTFDAGVGVEIDSGFEAGFFFSFFFGLFSVRFVCKFSGFPLTTFRSFLLGFFSTGAAASVVCLCFFVLGVVSDRPSFRLRSRRNLETSFVRVGYIMN